MRKRVRDTLSLLGLVAAMGCNGPITHRTPSPPPGPAVHAETARGLDERGNVSVSLSTENAQVVRIACSTCHSLRGSTELPTSAEALDEFHVDLQFAHGELSCASCHTPKRVEQLRLADGTPFCRGMSSFCAASATVRSCAITSAAPTAA